MGCSKNGTLSTNKCIFGHFIEFLSYNVINGGNLLLYVMYPRNRLISVWEQNVDPNLHSSIDQLLILLVLLIS